MVRALGPVLLLFLVLPPPEYFNFGGMCVDPTVSTREEEAQWLTH